MLAEWFFIESPYFSHTDSITLAENMRLVREYWTTMSDQNPKPETQAKPAKTPRVHAEDRCCRSKAGSTRTKAIAGPATGFADVALRRCRLEIIELMQSNERLLNIAILILGAVMAYGISVKAYEIVALGPLPRALSSSRASNVTNSSTNLAVIANTSKRRCRN